MKNKYQVLFRYEVIRLLIITLLIFFMPGCSLYMSSLDPGKEPLQYIFFPPHDLYDFLVYKKIDIENNGLVGNSIFRIKYQGTYAAGLIFENFPLIINKKQYDELKSEFKLKLQLGFYQGDELVLTQTTEMPILHFAHKKGSGFWLAEVYSPAELPKGDEIYCKIEVLVPDHAFSAKYGPVHFFITRVSEK